MLAVFFVAFITPIAILAAPAVLGLPRSVVLLDNSTIPANFTPSGGADTSPTSPPPVYHPLSDFDFQSLNLALNQEWIELDLFHHGLARFSVAEFQAAGLNAQDRFLIEYMADQEAGHATLITNILGPTAAKRCNYTYPFHTVRQFVDFSQKLTRFGESGVYGFLPHLDSRPSAQLLLQSITTEARQQLIFRQFAGAFPMPVSFETGLPQAFAWTMLQPYLTSCPTENPVIEFQIFPALNITNNPSIISTTTSGQIVTHESGSQVYYPTVDSPTSTNGTGTLYLANISTNRTTLSYPGREVNFKWDAQGKEAGYGGLYSTHSSAGTPNYAGWVSQLNVSYTPLYNINLTTRTASTRQPGGAVFPTLADGTGGGPAAPIVNDTMFIVLTDTNLTVTPYNLSLINPHVVAGPALYQAD